MTKAPYTHPACLFFAHHICKGYAFEGKKVLTCICTCHETNQDLETKND